MRIFIALLRTSAGQHCIRHMHEDIIGHDGLKYFGIETSMY
jgi:hypothetical protein